MNGNQLNALIERLQVHDHPKLLEYIMPNKEQNMTMTGEKQVQHHCNVLLRNILRMQGYNLSYVHQVIENVITIYKNNNEEDALTKMKKGGTLNCIIIIKQNVYIFNNIETLMPVSYVLSLAIRKYVEDNNGIDDSNAIGLYNLSQNFVLDLSDDVGDSMNTNDILGTTGYTVPCIGLKTKTKHPTKELAILKKVLMERQLDAQRLDKKISPLLLNVEDEEDDGEHIIVAINVKPTNVEKVAKQYLWEETVLFDMMKTKFNVDIFSIDIPPFLNNEDARAKAIENIENKRKMNRKGSKEIKLFIPSSGE